MEKLRIALVQSDIVWENIEENLSNYTEKLKAIHNVDLIILPEMFATGFTMNVKKNVQGENDSILNWLKEKSKEMNCAIYGSLIFEDEAEFYNRAYFVRENGELDHYDKRHLFTLANEDQNFSMGESREVIEYKGWRFFPQICYDLRFPVWSRNDLNYDIALYVANWPVKRRVAWQSLLKSRAIENMAYVLGVNRVGEDGNGFKYAGDSALIDPLGEVLSNTIEFEEKIEILEIEKDKLIKARKDFGFLNDMDDFSISL